MHPAIEHNPNPFNPHVSHQLDAYDGALDEAREVMSGLRAINRLVPGLPLGGAWGSLLLTAAELGERKRRLLVEAGL